jgi:hypothetical protein
MKWILIFLIIGLGAAQPAFDTETINVTGLGLVNVSMCNPYYDLFLKTNTTELTFVLGDGEGFSITREGLVTFENGQSIQVRC